MFPFEEEPMPTEPAPPKIVKGNKTSMARVLIVVGNSFALTIPSHVIRECGYKKGDSFRLVAGGGTIAFEYMGNTKRN